MHIIALRAIPNQETGILAEEDYTAGVSDASTWIGVVT
jgi:hypothetical protein